MSPTSERLKEARCAEEILCELHNIPHYGGPSEPDAPQTHTRTDSHGRTVWAAFSRMSAAVSA